MRLSLPPPKFAMNALTKFIRQAAFVLAAGTLLSAACTDASAQTAPRLIANTALAEWDVGGSKLTINSNTVEFAIESTPTPPGISLFRLSSGPGSITQPLPGSMCAGNNGRVPMALGGPYADTQLSAASLVSTTAIRAGEPLIIRVDAPLKEC